jgi:hypothetical protein
MDGVGSLLIALAKREPASNGATRARICARVFLSSVGTTALTLRVTADDCQSAAVARAALTQCRAKYLAVVFGEGPINAIESVNFGRL